MAPPLDPDIADVDPTDPELTVYMSWTYLRILDANIDRQMA